MKLLHLDSSIQGEASASRAVTKAVVDRLNSIAHDLQVQYRDLAIAPIDHLTLMTLGGGGSLILMDEFQAAGIIVIGAPLYNFTIPSQLKAWFDRIIIAGKTFRYTENGPEGLSNGKMVIVVLSRGGVYDSTNQLSDFEHAESLLRTMLSFIGIKNAQFIIAEGLALGEERRTIAIKSALLQAENLTMDVN